MTIDDVFKEATEQRPLYTHAVWTLYPVRQEGVGTIVADKYCRLYYDPEVLGVWTLPQCAGKVLQQIEHLLRQHGQRQGKRENVIWRVATEMAVNSSFEFEGIPLPMPILLPETYTLPDSLTAEEYYDRLFELCKGRHRALFGRELGSKPPTAGSAVLNQVQEWELPEDSDAPMVDALLMNLLISQMTPTDDVSEGGLAGDREIMVPDERAATVAWRRELRSVSSSLLASRPGGDDYSFAVPNSDFALSPDVLMPGMVARRPNLAYVIDTSGSMGDDRLAAALAELKGLIRVLNANEGVHVYTVDTAVHTVQEVFQHRQVSLVGGGCTAIGVGIQAAARQLPKPDLMIVVTDGFTEWPRHPPRGIRIVIVLVGNGKLPRWRTRVIRVPGLP